MTARREAFGLSVWLLVLGFVAAASTAEAQTVRHVGRAVGNVSGGATTEAHAAGEMGDEVSCDMSDDCCFDQPNGCEAAPSGSRTFGGAGPAVFATPGFPRTVSRVGSITATISGSIVALSGVQAIADSDGIANEGAPEAGGLFSSCGVVTVTSNEVTDVILPDPGIDIPLTGGTVARCTTRTRIQNGFSSIEVIVQVVEPEPGATPLLDANALAGVEIPFTDGGAGCAVSRSGPSALPETLGWLVVLGWALRRRRAG